MRFAPLLFVGVCTLVFGAIGLKISPVFPYIGLRFLGF